jgi:hypothetical protein
MPVQYDGRLVQPPNPRSDESRNSSMGSGTAMLRKSNDERYASQIRIPLFVVEAELLTLHGFVQVVRVPKLTAGGGSDDPFWSYPVDYQPHLTPIFAHCTYTSFS